MIKVNRPGTSSLSSVRRRNAAGAKGDGTFSAELAQPTAQGASAAPVRGTDALSSLLALQEVGDATDERSRGRAHGEEMLDHLDRIRLGLLAGAIPKSALTGLLATVRDRRVRVTDPRLQQVLDEIELRAAVELAKLRQMP